MPPERALALPGVAICLPLCVPPALRQDDLLLDGGNPCACRSPSVVWPCQRKPQIRLTYLGSGRGCGTHFLSRTEALAVTRSCRPGARRPASCVPARPPSTTFSSTQWVLVTYPPTRVPVVAQLRRKTSSSTNGSGLDKLGRGYVLLGASRTNTKTARRAAPLGFRIRQLSRSLRPDKRRPIVLIDILIAIVIVVIAAILGIVVHPILWVIVIAAVLWLFFRRGRW
jgi:hypothetical protein